MITPQGSYTASECPPYYYSNDIWTSKAVEDLSTAAAQFDPSTTASVVVGPSSIPHLVAHLRSAEVFVVDQYRTVAEETVDRAESLGRHGGWREYDQYHEYRDRLGSFACERRHAVTSGLRINYETTRSRVDETELVPVHGEIVRTLPRLGKVIADSGYSIGILYLTNVASYITAHDAPGAWGGARLLADVAAAGLPLTDASRIIDASLTDLRPTVYTLTGFRQKANEMIARERARRVT